MSYVVVLTGGIGSGKSTVSNFFSDLSIEIIDCDVISRKILKPGSIILKKIFQKFGKIVINSDHSLNRYNLRKIIFSSYKNKVWIDKLMHPIIYDYSIKKINNSNSLWCLWVIPLLECNIFPNYIDRIAVVHTSEKIQIKRIALRDNDNKENIKNIISLQPKKYLTIAHDIIKNHSTKKNLFLKLNKLYKMYNKLAIKKYMNK